MSGDLRPESPSRQGWQRRLFRWPLEFVILFGFWLLLSGNFQLQFLIFGAFCSAIVVMLTRDLFFPRNLTRFSPPPHNATWLFATGLRFLWYLPWLLLQIVLANLNVAYLVLHPRMPIDPRLIRFKTDLKTEPSQVLLAQSITLTPGTITIDIDEQGQFLVHALSSTASAGLSDASLQNKVAAVFGQGPSDPKPLTVITDPSQLT
jgi:multicomponent Na+:H+ antiporter subunit E